MRRLRVLLAVVLTPWWLFTGLGNVLVVPAGAEAAGVASAGGAPDPAPPDAAAPERCTLKKSPRLADAGEFLTCLSVEASLNRAPAVGETATLTVAVQAEARRDATVVEVDLAEHLQLVEQPSRFADSAIPVAGRTTRRSSGRVDLGAGTTTRFVFRVRAAAEGAGTITARAYGAHDAGSDTIGVTSGATAAASVLAFDMPTSAEAVALPAADDIAAPAASAARWDDPVLGRAPLGPGEVLSPVAGPEPGRSCITTRLAFYTTEGTWKGAMNLVIQAMDKDVGSAADLLATGYADPNGSIELCFANNDEEGSLTQEVYLLYVTANNRWRVQDTPTSGSRYLLSYGATAPFSIADNTTYAAGTVYPPSSSWHRPFRAYDAVNAFWLWRYPPDGGACWDRFDAACRIIRVNWTSTSTDGTYYSFTDKQVHLAAADPDAGHTVVHEAAHAVMFDMYEDAAVPGAGGAHAIKSCYTEGLAWTEGWAEWVPASVYNDPYYRWPDGFFLNLETPTWGSDGWCDGDRSEGRVAGAMIDVSDAATDEPWDTWGEGDPGPWWETTVNHYSPTFRDFWSDRAAQGYSVADGGPRGSLYQSTIDYDFRDPLAAYVERTRPRPLTAASTHDHRYSYNTTAGYWSAVAVRPEVSNVDLRLYDDRAQTTLLATSGSPVNVIDFIAVDSNSGNRALGDYYPKVSLFAGATADHYDVELAHGTATFANGTHALVFGADDVLRIGDHYSNPGTRMYVRVVPAGGQNVDLFVLESNDADATTDIRRRSDAVAVATVAGGGSPEALAYTRSLPGNWSAIVVTQTGGEGTATLYVDESAPVGSVSIDAGAAATTSRSVMLSLSASDAQTGVKGVRVSTDGVLDTEPELAYSPLKSATLPAGDGTKTVLVQFVNNAGQRSAAFSDTILLDTIVAPMSPPDLVAASDTGSSSTDDVTAAATDLGFTGFVEPGSTVILRRDGSDVANGTAPNGTWTLADVGPVPEGLHRYSAAAIDPHGNGASSSELAVYVDGTPPAQKYLYIDDPTVLEPDVGSAMAVFTVSLSQSSAFAVTVEVASAAGSATSGVDFDAVAPTTVTIPAGALSAPVAVPVLGDTRPEPVETFEIRMRTPVGALLADMAGVGRIVSDEGELSAYIGDAYAVEGGAGAGGTVHVPVRLSGAAVEPVTVTVATVNGTALAGSDFTSLPPTVLTFAPGDVVKTISLPLIGDAVVEPNEIFKLKVTGTSGAVSGDSIGALTIINDDGTAGGAPVPSVTIDDASVVEGPSATSNLVMTMRLSRPATLLASVSWYTTAKTATAGVDYTSVSPTVVTFAAGESVKTISVPVVGDTLREPIETFVVRLTSPLRLSIADAAATATILSEEGPLHVYARNAIVVEGNTGTTTLAMPIDLGAPLATGESLSLRVRTSGGTATAGTDYVAVPETAVTFAVGEQRKVVSVSIRGDVTRELKETFDLVVVSSTGVIGDGVGSALILNDD